MKSLGVGLTHLLRLEDIICQKASELPLWPGQGGHRSGGWGPLPQRGSAQRPGLPTAGPSLQEPSETRSGGTAGLWCWGQSWSRRLSAPTAPGHLPKPDSFVPQAESGHTWARAPFLSHGPTSRPISPARASSTGTAAPLQLHLQEAQGLVPTGRSWACSSLG